jgi:clan AA aspartic protease
MNQKEKQMGAVYVTVRLSNAIDVEMARQGLLEQNKVRTFEGAALVDTGATRSVIPPDIAKHLGLGIYRQATGLLADGTRVSCGVCTGIRFEINGRETLEDAYVMGDSVLIGQTVLESTDLFVDCVNRRVIPNPAHPEGPVFRL